MTSPSIPIMINGLPGPYTNLNKLGAYGRNTAAKTIEHQTKTVELRKAVEADMNSILQNAQTLNPADMLKLFQLQTQAKDIRPANLQFSDVGNLSAPERAEDKAAGKKLAYDAIGFSYDWINTYDKDKSGDLNLEELSTALSEEEEGNKPPDGSKSAREALPGILGTLLNNGGGLDGLLGGLSGMFGGEPAPSTELPKQENKPDLSDLESLLGDNTKDTTHKPGASSESKKPGSGGLGELLGGLGSLLDGNTQSSTETPTPDKLDLSGLEDLLGEDTDNQAGKPKTTKQPQSSSPGLDLGNLLGGNGLGSLGQFLGTALQGLLSGSMGIPPEDSRAARMMKLLDTDNSNTIGLEEKAASVIYTDDAVTYTQEAVTNNLLSQPDQAQLNRVVPQLAQLKSVQDGTLEVHERGVADATLSNGLQYPRAILQNIANTYALGRRVAEFKQDNQL